MVLGDMILVNFDWLIIFRLVYFWKNMTGINDEFWFFFLSLINVVICIGIEAIRILMGFHLNKDIFNLTGFEECPPTSKVIMPVSLISLVVHLIGYPILMYAKRKTALIVGPKPVLADNPKFNTSARNANLLGALHSTIIWGLLILAMVPGSLVSLGLIQPSPTLKTIRMLLPYFICSFLLPGAFYLYNKRARESLEKTIANHLSLINFPSFSRVKTCSSSRE